MQQVFGRAVTKAIPDLPAPDEPPHTAALGDADDLRQRLLSTGFARAHVVSVTHLLAFESPEWLVKQMQSVAPPAVEFFETLTTVQHEAFKRAFVEDFQERQGDGPYGVTNEALIGVGTRAAASGAASGQALAWWRGCEAISVTASGRLLRRNWRTAYGVG
jgi:hypothetical protein